MIEYLVLGNVQVVCDGAPVQVNAAMHRRLLALLLASPGRAIPADQVVDALWHQRPPRTARKALHVYIHQLRNALGAHRLSTEPAGYVLKVWPGELDAEVFHSLTRRADAQYAAGDPVEASRLLSQALGLWRGAAFDGVGDLPAVDAERARLAELRIAAIERHATIGLELGLHTDLIPVLTEAIQANPYLEKLHGLLMRALFREGRQAHALEIFANLRERLATELGLDPSADLQRLQMQILIGDPKLRRAIQNDPAVLAPSPQPSVPQHLPADLPDFTGRRDALEQLDRWLVTRGDGPIGTMVISAITGTGGVGKSALAVRWAHAVSLSFPDGQLYLNLRGYDRLEPASVLQALNQLLTSLGVPPGKIPADVDGAASMYRSLLAGKRILILLDNARTVAQVRPLLPASARCLVLITSRDQLAGLIARDGAQHLALDMLSPAEALDLLRRIAGHVRVDDELDAAGTLAEHCGYLPLAVRVAAATLAVDPRRRIADLAESLGRDRRLSALEIQGDHESSVRVVFDQSYLALPDGVRRMFRLLGLMPTNGFTVGSAAALADLTTQDTEQLLHRLVTASLVTQVSGGRFTLHDLLRDYAREQAGALDSPGEQQTASDRLLRYYIHSANSADELMYPQRNPAGFDLPPHTHIEPLTTRQDAIRWFRSEHPSLLALLAETARSLKDEDARSLATFTANYLEWNGPWADALSIQLTALQAAHRMGDLGREARCHKSIGGLYSKIGRDEDAHRHLQAALDAYVQIGDHIGTAEAHVRISIAMESRQRHTEALRYAEQAEALYRETTDKRGWAHALNNVAWNLAQLGRYDEAVQPCAAAIEIFERIEDLWGLAGSWDSLGYIRHHLGAHTLAADAYLQALQQFRRLGNRFNEADTLEHLGDTWKASGDTALAYQAWESAAEIFTELGHARAATLALRLKEADIGHEAAQR